MVEAPRPTFMQLVLNQFKDFIIILLIVAAVISALLGEYIDAGAIMLIVILNAVLAVIQESRAEQALAALKKAGLQPAGTILASATPDEETGGFAGIGSGAGRMAYTAAVAIGSRVEMTFRRLYEASGGVQNYFWKARPVA